MKKTQNKSQGSTKNAKNAQNGSTKNAKSNSKDCS